MGRPQKTCRLCGQPARPGESFTHRGYHYGCGLRRAEDAARQMAAKAGPYYDRWLASNGPRGTNRYTGTPPAAAA